MCVCVRGVVVGCADLTTLDDDGAPHWMQRSGDFAVFGCNGSSVTWRLQCDGDRWLGERALCPYESSSGIVASFQPFTLLGRRPNST